MKTWRDGMNGMILEIKIPSFSDVIKLLIFLKILNEFLKWFLYWLTKNTTHKKSLHILYMDFRFRFYNRKWIPRYLFPIFLSRIIATFSLFTYKFFNEIVYKLFSVYSNKQLIKIMVRYSDPSFKSSLYSVFLDSTQNKLNII